MEKLWNWGVEARWWTNRCQVGVICGDVSLLRMPEDSLLEDKLGVARTLYDDFVACRELSRLARCVSWRGLKTSKRSTDVAVRSGEWLCLQRPRIVASLQCLGCRQRSDARATLG